LGAIKRTPTFFLASDHPTLPFGFEIGKSVKYANLNSDQLDLILGQNLARLLKIEPTPSLPPPETSCSFDFLGWQRSARNSRIYRRKMVVNIPSRLSRFSFDTMVQE